MRDWLSTLWRASWKGFPFYFERDEESGGRGLVVHQFPMRDDPYIEDLGEDVRVYSGTAYVHGDTADAQAIRFSELLASRGAGSLVIPIRGPVDAHCEHFTRVHERDRMGFIAFQVKFVRAGARAGLASLPLAGREVLLAADAVARALAAGFHAAVKLADMPEYVVETAVDGVALAAAAVDTIREQTPVPPLVAIDLREATAAIVAAAPVLLTHVIRTQPYKAAQARLRVAVPWVGEPADTPQSRLLAGAVAATVRALGDAVPADTAARVMIDMADAFAAPVGPLPLSLGEAQAAHNAAVAARLARLSALTAWCEALVRQPFADRPTGISVRAEASRRFDAELHDCEGFENAVLYRALHALRGQVVALLTARIANAQRVVRVAMPRSLPSIVLGWDLYGAPLRGRTVLAARNRVPNPLVMPLEFEALA